MLKIKKLNKTKIIKQSRIQTTKNKKQSENKIIKINKIN